MHADSPAKQPILSRFRGHGRGCDGAGYEIRLGMDGCASGMGREITRETERDGKEDGARRPAEGWMIGETVEGDGVGRAWRLQMRRAHVARLAAA